MSKEKESGVNPDQKKHLVMENINEVKQLFQGTCPKCGQYATFTFVFVTCIEQCQCGNCKEYV